MNSALLIENTVLEIQELLPYYTKSYIRESIKLLSESDEILSKKKSVFDVIKDKGGKALKKGSKIFLNYFKRLVAFNLYLIIAAQIYVATMGHISQTSNDEYAEQTNELAITINEEIPDDPDAIKMYFSRLKNQLFTVISLQSETSESGKQSMLQIINPKEFYEKKEDIEKEVETSINKKFKKTILFLGEEYLNLGVTISNLTASFYMSLKGKNTFETHLNRAHKKIIAIQLKLKSLKDKENENKLKSLKDKRERSDEAVLRSYIKNVILESKA